MNDECHQCYDLAQLEKRLVDLAQTQSFDWGLEIEVAHECAWSGEGRLTWDPNQSGGLDRSLVLYSVGHLGPAEAARHMLVSMLLEVEKRTEEAA